MLPTFLIVPYKIDADDLRSVSTKVRINENIDETKLIPLWKFDTNDCNRITHTDTSAFLGTITLIGKHFCGNTYLRNDNEIKTMIIKKTLSKAQRTRGLS